MRRRLLITAPFLTALALGAPAAQGLVGTSPTASGRTLSVPFDGAHSRDYFVSVPSIIRAGQMARFATRAASKAVVPGANFMWSFGDGSQGTGPSVEHTFAHPGSDGVNLTVTDAGGCNSRSLTQTVDVVGSSSAQRASTSSLRVALQLLPQSLHSVLSSGLAVRVRANEAADGVTTMCVPNAAARRARVNLGDDPHGLVDVGRGTVTGIRKGRMAFRIRLDRSTAAKLSRLSQLTLTLRMTLFARNGLRTVVSATGQY